MSAHAMESDSRPQGRGHDRHSYWSPRFWLLPMLVLLLLGGAGTALYIGGLGSPGDHLKHFPLAVVNQDRGATPPDGGSPENLGQNITDQMQQGFAQNDEIDLRVLSWDEAQDQLRKGQIHGAVVIPESFSADALGLVSGALTDTEVTRPSITVYTNPLAGPLASTLGTAAVDPALEQANTGLGEQLTSAAEEAQAAARAEQQRELGELGLPAQVQEQVAPTVDGTSTDLLRAPIAVTTTAFETPPEGSALGMGAFFYSVLLMVVGVSGSVAIHFLVDSRLGVAPVEMGPRFALGPRVQPARWKTYLVKWGIVVLGALPTAGLMMWVASAVGMPIPHGGWFFLTTWLSIVTVSAVTTALITLFGSIGMVLSLIYVVFMGLPAATGVVPLEALPGFFTFIARGEPLYQMTMANRAVLYFDAEGDAGLQSGIIGMLILILIAVAVAMIFSVLYDRMFGRRRAELVPTP
ncbi:YhgE/Pip domain-containing protein [Arthrobacter sp. zg-Y1171]|uniref:YhgE/Pip domain-containing protein n=1 Tax=Arthrobacter sp. zg-Y1171 TaxID=2964610 RepID=UPI00210213CA|nr:ABC transporter permease [Arthrobacter sp. zg-Y1171]MCQ1995675.1 ABC transporter permease [Arthrobacter sp. zg-Y1171]UWX83237.1 ABC transporter permease [Arthrobacter sp. zg-Y1171]